MPYSLEPRTRKPVKGYGFLSFARKYRKQLLDTELNAPKTASKKVVHEAAEATGEFLGNKIADKILKPKYVIDENPRNAGEIIILQKKKEKKKKDRETILNELRQLL